jgi:hypothetical protein
VGIIEGSDGQDGGKCGAKITKGSMELKIAAEALTFWGASGEA